MPRLNKKDKRLLYNLDSNCRQTLNQLGKASGMSKEVVASRIKSLEEAGILKGYYTTVDFLRLRYTSIRISYKFKNTTPEDESEIIRHFVESNLCGVAYSTSHNYNLIVILDIKNNDEFYNFWQKTQDKYSKKIEEQLTAHYLKTISFRPTYLLDEKERPYDEPSEVTGGNKTASSAESDDALLSAISTDARISLLKLSRILHQTPTTIKDRMNYLKNLGIIQAYRAQIDTEKLGYYWFRLDILLDDHTKRHEITRYIARNPHLIAIDFTTGPYHMELEFHLRDINHLRKITDDLCEKYSNAIQRTDYIAIKKIHKFSFMPNH